MGHGVWQSSAANDNRRETCLGPPCCLQMQHASIRGRRGGGLSSCTPNGAPHQPLQSLGGLPVPHPRLNQPSMCQRGHRRAVPSWEGWSTSTSAQPGGLEGCTRPESPLLKTCKGLKRGQAAGVSHPDGYLVGRARQAGRPGVWGFAV